MAVKIDEVYEATVASAMMTVSQEKGTGGLAMVYNTTDGQTKRVWYVTPATVERLKENLNKCFGITDEQLDSAEFLRSIGNFLRGKPCSVVTEAETDMHGNVKKDTGGNPYATVKWMNPSRLGREASDDSLAKMASIFGGRSVASSGSSEPPPPQWGPGGQIDDSDVPF